MTVIILLLFQKQFLVDYMYSKFNAIKYLCDILMLLFLKLLRGFIIKYLHPSSLF